MNDLIDLLTPTPLERESNVGGTKFLTRTLRIVYLYFCRRVVLNVFAKLEDTHPK